jgi:hypothetical protein
MDLFQWGLIRNHSEMRWRKTSPIAEWLTRRRDVMLAAAVLCGMKMSAKNLRLSTKQQQLLQSFFVEVVDPLKPMVVDDIASLLLHLLLDGKPVPDKKLQTSRGIALTTAGLNKHRDFGPNQARLDSRSACSISPKIPEPPSHSPPTSPAIT